MTISNIEILSIILIILGLSNWYIYWQNKNNNYNYDDTILDKINNSIDIKLKNNFKNLENEINKQLIHSNNEINKQLIHSNKNIINQDKLLYPEDYVSRRDNNVVHNNFAPPERRDYKGINIPTRGFPDNYQLIGILLRDNTESGYNLYGRQKYPGSNQYEYYIQGVFNNNNIKIPYKSKGDKEMEDDVEIHVPGTNKTNGLFKLKLYNYDLPRYIPQIL
jgi:hypothetical protein